MKFVTAFMPIIGVLFMLLAQAQAAPAKATMMPVGTAQVYKKVGEQELRLWILKPQDWKATDRRAAIVFFHGGGWVSGTPSQFNAQSQHFAERGLVCIQVQYRLLKAKDGEPPLVCIQDAKSAMRWVRSHAAELGIDTQRIAAGGGSAGGHLAACTALIEGLDDAQDDLTISPKPQALMLFNPVFDNGPGEYGYERVKERYKEFSPAHNIAPGAPPTIVFLGTRDQLIPVATVERFQRAMTAAGARCEAKFFEGKSHGFFNSPPDRTETLQAADEFLVSLGWLPVLNGK